MCEGFGLAVGSLAGGGICVRLRKTGDVWILLGDWLGGLVGGILINSRNLNLQRGYREEKKVGYR